MMKTSTTKLLTLLAITCTLPLAVYAGDSKDMKEIRMTPVLEEASHFYVAVEGGADFTNVSGTDGYQIGNTGPTSFFSSGIFKGDGNTVNTVGGVGGLKVGYDFDPYNVCEGLSLQPAVEVEGLYIGGTGTNKFSYSSPEIISVKSNYENAAVLLNGIVRFKIDSPLTPYVGFGVGGEYFNATDISLQDNFGVHYGTFNYGSWALAGQGLVGLDYELAKHWSLFTEYKFIIMDSPRTQVHNFGNTGANYTYRPDYVGQNIGVIGVKYSF